MAFMPVIVHIVMMYICSSCDASSVVGACTEFWGMIMIYRKAQFTKIRLDILYQSIMQCRLFITDTTYACHDMTKSASLRYFTLINFINLHALPPLETYQDCACLCDRLIADWLREKEPFPCLYDPSGYHFSIRYADRRGTGYHDCSWNEIDEGSN